MKRLNQSGRAETHCVNEVGYLPADVNVNDVVTIKIAKASDLISIVWRQNNTLFGVKGTYKDYIKAIMKFKQQIIKRPRKEDRFEYWEALNEFGVYSLEMEYKIRKMRRM